MEEKVSGGKPSSEGYRNNMISAFTYYADYSLPINEEPGNIIITDCIIENTDRFLHYNYSGNEIWQKNRPLRNICFKNIRAIGIRMPLTVYGDAKNPVTIELSNIDASFGDGTKYTVFMHACNYERITFDTVAISNNNRMPLIKTWSDGKIEIKDLICDTLRGEN